MKIFVSHREKFIFTALAGLLTISLACLGTAAERGLLERSKADLTPSGGGAPPGPFGDDWLHLQENGFVDSYDSRVANYDPDNPGQKANAGTNCKAASGPWLTMDNNSSVLGDLSVTKAEGETPIYMGNGSSITGSSNYSAGEWILKPITPPGTYTQSDDTGLHGEYGSKTGKYEITSNNFTMHNNAKAIIDAGVYHFNSMELSNGSEFQIDPNIGDDEVVEIYVDTSINFENNSELIPPIEVTGDSTKLRIYFSGTQTVDLSNNVTFYGFIYAPNAQIEIRNNDNVFGNLVAKEIWLWNNGGVHYDEALMAENFGNIFVPPPVPPTDILEWREIIK